MRRPAALLLALAAAAPGCRASLARLERGHHYDEALCGARENAFPEGQVLEVLRRGLDPALHVAVVPRERTPELGERALVRVLYDSNEIPLRGFEARLRLRRGDRSQLLERLELAELAAALDERTPRPRTVGGDSGAGLGHALVETGRAIGAVGAVILQVSTLGLFGRIFRGGGRTSSSSSSSSHTIYPTEQEIRGAAPRGAALFDSVAHLQSSYCGEAPGATCRRLGLVDAPLLEQGELTLELDLRYRARCTWDGLVERLEIPLPPGPTLEARVHALFGDRMRRLAELPVRPRAGG